MIDLKMNLKICEGCGVLWIRSAHVSTVYCSRCTRMLAEMPAVRSRQHHRARRFSHRPQLTRVPALAVAPTSGGAR